MNSATATIVFMIFITVEQFSGSYFREKQGSCPMYKVMSWSALCEQEKAECDTDYVCDGDLKCCEDERCGVSKCTKPIIDVVKQVRFLEICPVEGSVHSVTGCRQVETKFCFKINCARCCTHRTNCNPAHGVLLRHDECQMEDPRPNITYERNSVKSGESLRIVCQPKKEASLIEWAKMVQGSLLKIPALMIDGVEGKKAILKIDNSTAGDAGNYTCRVISDRKTYYREVAITVKRSDDKNTCFLPLQRGLCDGNLTSFHYDVKDDTCKVFRFRGCKGNDNNFASRLECERTCKGTKLKCPASGLSKFKSCSPNQRHQCQNDENCGYRRTCCLVGCTRRCMDPSKPWMAPTTFKPSESTGKPTTPEVKVQCGKRFCSHFAKCQTNLAGWKECVCPKACRFSAIRPVCGKDISTGKERIYPSMCFLKIRSCRLQRSIKPVRIDKCANHDKQTNTSRDLCDVKECSPHANCVINQFNGQPQCLCPRFCSFKPKRVCGSDGRTYLNECLMKVISCKKNLYVKRDYFGPCNKL